MKRVLLTGFDPFTLDRDIRISNPSGAVALALDGAVIDTPDGPARVGDGRVPRCAGRTSAEGAVERALRPYLPRVDLFTTVSQGRAGRFDVERTNGAWRGGFPDNENAAPAGDRPGDRPGLAAAVDDDHAAVRGDHGRGHGTLPGVRPHERDRDPGGGTEPVVRPDGPTRSERLS
ncbi:Pyroglutamyl peptidase OS=Streptomyces tendae OX=1932 GN=GUR47_10510 PE=4 SV=1 [Streptomyces tendae]